MGRDTLRYACVELGEEEAGKTFAIESGHHVTETANCYFVKSAAHWRVKARPQTQVSIKTINSYQHEQYRSLPIHRQDRRKEEVPLQQKLAITVSHVSN